MTTTDRAQPRVTLGDLIKRARLDAGLDQQALADKIGRSRSSIGHWERGRGQPDFADMRRIIEATGATWLLTEPFREEGGTAMRCYQNSPVHGLVGTAA